MASVRCSAEFVIEPFVDGAPGSHVLDGIAAVEGHGLDVAIGPFGSTVSGSVDDVATAIADMLRVAMDGGADRILVHVVSAER